MTLNEYQEIAAKNSFFSPTKSPVPGLYEALGLAGESGEVAEKHKKFWRDGGDPQVMRLAVQKELGDALWYLSQCAKKWGFTLEDIAQGNLAKIAARRENGTLSGSGDDR